MGCDIHLFVEAKGSPNNDWNRLERTVSFSNWRTKFSMDLGWGEGRNYNAFAMLADVRNGRGFAGVDLGNGFEPISPPRGLPKDADYGILDEAERWGADGHSHSWFTLRELLDLEAKGYWAKTTEHRGVFLRNELEQAKKDDLVLSIDGQKVRLSGPPRSWAGDISGPPLEDIFHLSFEQTYRESAGWLLRTTIPAMTEIASSYAMSDYFRQGLKKEDPNSRQYPTVCDPHDPPVEHWVDSASLIRMVFWFDN